MTDDELRALSIAVEDLCGFDSIPTIESNYLRDPEPDGPFLCAFSDGNTYGHHDCRFRRRDPIAMWRHVHFTGHPPPSLRVARPEDVDLDWLREHVADLR